MSVSFIAPALRLSLRVTAQQGRAGLHGRREQGDLNLNAAAQDLILSRLGFLKQSVTTDDLNLSLIFHLIYSYGLVLMFFYFASTRPYVLALCGAVDNTSDLGLFDPWFYDNFWSSIPTHAGSVSSYDACVVRAVWP
jgi:hypothetical protein